MPDHLDAPSSPLGEQMPTAQPARLVWLALVVLGSFEIGRLISGTLIGPWLAERFLGWRAPVVVGDVDLLRVAIEVVAIALGVCVAALIAIPLAKVVHKR